MILLQFFWQKLEVRMAERVTNINESRVLHITRKFFDIQFICINNSFFSFLNKLEQIQFFKVLSDLYTRTLYIVTLLLYLSRNQSGCEDINDNVNMFLLFMFHLMKIIRLQNFAKQFSSHSRIKIIVLKTTYNSHHWALVYGDRLLFLEVGWRDGSPHGPAKKFCTVHALNLEDRYVTKITRCSLEN